MPLIRALLKEERAPTPDPPLTPPRHSPAFARAKGFANGGRGTSRPVRALATVSVARMSPRSGRHAGPRTSRLTPLIRATRLQGTSPLRVVAQRVPSIAVELGLELCDAGEEIVLPAYGGETQRRRHKADHETLLTEVVESFRLP